jgi:hypothetical protein
MPVLSSNLQPLVSGTTAFICSLPFFSRAIQVGDVVVDGNFFSGGGGSSAWSGNRSFVFTLAAPTSLLFAVSSLLRFASSR